MVVDSSGRGCMQKYNLFGGGPRGGDVTCDINSSVRRILTVNRAECFERYMQRNLCCRSNEGHIGVIERAQHKCLNDSKRFIGELS